MTILDRFRLNGRVALVTGAAKVIDGGRTTEEKIREIKGKTDKE